MNFFNYDLYFLLIFSILLYRDKQCGVQNLTQIQKLRKKQQKKTMPKKSQISGNKLG